MSYSLTYQIGRVQAGEGDLIAVPGKSRGNGRYGVVLNHGAGTPEEYASANAFWSTRLGAALANAGIPWITPSDSIDRLANDVEMSRITTAISTLAVAAGCSSKKAFMIGVSQGGGASLRYASLYPANVAGVAGIIPLASINNVYVQNPTGPISTGLSSKIATAWSLSFTVLTVTLTNGSAAMVATTGAFTSAMATGHYLVIKNVGSVLALDATVPFGTTVSAFTDATHATLSAPFTGTTGSYQIAVAQPLPANANINSIAGAIATAAIPTRLYYSSVDTVIQVSDVTTVATTAGGQAILVDATYGHSDTTVGLTGNANGAQEYGELITWLKLHGA